MKHALTILANTADTAETNAPKREAAADAYARDGEHERAENLRSQADLDRAVAADCRAALAPVEFFQIVDEALNRRPHLLFEIGYNRITDWMVHVYDATGVGIKAAPLVITIQCREWTEAMTEAVAKINELYPIPT